MKKQIKSLFMVVKKSSLSALLIISCMNVYAPEAIDVGQVLDDTVHMLEQVDPAMAAQMKNITPEQQKELEQQLNVVFEKMGTLSPEELKHLEQHPEEMFDFVEKTVSEQGAQAAPAPQQAPAAKIPEEKTVVAPTPTRIKPTPEILKAADLLESIIRITEEFILKETAANLESKINRWAEKNKIKNWQTGLKYKKFKEQLLSLVKKLRTIKEERDPETKQAVFIDALTKNSALLNSLQRLNNTLTAQWELVVLPDQDLDTLVMKLSRETKDALKAMLGAYAQALLNMPMQLDSLMKEYGPRAQELREKEAQLSEKALKERKLPYAQPMQGLGASGSGYGRGRSPDYEYGPYAGYGPYYGGEGYQPYQDYRGSQPSAGESQGAGKKGGDSEKGKKETKQDKEKEEQKKEKEIAKVTPKDKKDRTRELAKEDLKEIENALNEAQESINKHGDFLQNAPTKTKAQSTKRADAFYGDLEAITKKIDRAKEPLQFFHYDIRLLEKKEQTELKKKCADLWQTKKGFFQAILTQIDSLQQKERAALAKTIKAIPEKSTQKADENEAVSSQTTAAVEMGTQTENMPVSGEDIQQSFGKLPSTPESLAQEIAMQPQLPLSQTGAIKQANAGTTKSTPIAQELPEEPQTPLSPLSKALHTLIEQYDKVTAL